MSSKTEKIILGGGCFWCIEAVYRKVRGVISVFSGYAGGNIPNPTYTEVCSEETGHAEVVEITFDPQIISLEIILDIFWTIHDPTSLNRQGADVGTQYRSVVYFHAQKHEEIIKKSVKELKIAGIFENKIVTEIAPLKEFYPAEDYHQDYFYKNPNQGYCQVVISPKLSKFKQKFQDYLNFDYG